MLKKRSSKFSDDLIIGTVTRLSPESGAAAEEAPKERGRGWPTFSAACKTTCTSMSVMFRASENLCV